MYVADEQPQWFGYFRREEGCLPAIFEKRILGDHYMSRSICWNGIDETWLEGLYHIVDVMLAVKGR